MNNLFNNKTPNFKKLLAFGFNKKNGFLEFNQKIFNDEFTVNIKIFLSGEIKTKIIENSTKEIYTLHLVEGVTGSFVKHIRSEYENILKNIVENCFETDVFKFDMTKKIINYISENYGDYPEYLWEKFPENCIFRRKDNQKWYAAILTVQRDRFGFESDEIVEIINLKVPKENMENIIKQKNIYSGWHMNKKSWISIILDGSLKFENICEFINLSYNIVSDKVSG